MTEGWFCLAPIAKTIPLTQLNKEFRVYMGKVFIQIVHNKRIEIEEKDLIERIEKILPSLEGFIEYNLTNSNIQANTTLYHTRHEPGYLISYIHMRSPVPMASLFAGFNLMDSDDFYFTLKDIVNQTKLIVDDLKNGNARPRNTQFPVEMTSTTPQNFSLTMAKIIDATICESCKGLYTKNGLSAHAGSLRCMRDAQVLDVEALGYEIVDDPGAVAAIRKARLDFKVRPSALDMWAPPWVCKAVNDYRKDSKGYAGMKLHEFLKAIHGTKNNA